jgi:ferredoxin
MQTQEQPTAPADDAPAVAEGTLPPAPPTPSVESATEVGRLVRCFHAGDPGAADHLDAPGEGFLPALMEPFRDPRRVRHEFPLFLYPADAEAEGPIAAPLAELLRSLAGESGQILQDNLPRVERFVLESLGSADPPVDATSCLAEAARAVEESLKLSGDSGRLLHDDLEKLLAAVPAGGTLLALGEHAALHLFLHEARRRAARRTAALRSTIADLANRLRDLLRTDLAKRGGGEQPDALADTIGPAGQAYLDPDALAKVLGPSRGSPPMDEARRERILAAINTFERHLPQTAPLAVIVHHEDVPESCRAEGTEWRPAGDAGACAAATDLFDEIAGAHAPLFAAIRTAKLELAGAYDPARHDALQAHFDWRSFSPDELLDLPPILALESAGHLAGTGMLDLTRLLLSGRLINVIVAVEPAANPGLGPDEDPLAGFRFELGYLGVSHREAVVSQSSAARPLHLLAGYRLGLKGTRAALHVVSRGDWLHAGAALEGRAHPFFHYNPEAGETWARRLDFSANPQPENDWPIYTLSCKSADGGENTLPLAFTFADFALMQPAYRDHLRVLPPDADDEHLVTVDEYLTLLSDEAPELIPYTWASDGENVLHRVVISQRLAFACRDRLAYWRTLQELAGVRNEYVREAVQREKTKLEAEFAEQRAALEEVHAAAVDAARAEATGVAMRNLAEALLAGDAAALPAPTAPAPAPAAPVEEAAPAEEEAPAAEPEVEEVEVAEEPWIDTALCTSCNDCMDINAQVFTYNANKQAIIGDPTAGTFEEIVKAAEKCPARCIHPGKPLNPNEPNLEALIERAKPFNV